jgi:hypothetical protein
MTVTPTSLIRAAAAAAVARRVASQASRLQSPSDDNTITTAVAPPITRPSGACPRSAAGRIAGAL